MMNLLGIFKKKVYYVHDKQFKIDNYHKDSNCNREVRKYDFPIKYVNKSFADYFGPNNFLHYKFKTNNNTM